MMSNQSKAEGIFGYINNKVQDIKASGKLSVEESIAIYILENAICFGFTHLDNAIGNHLIEGVVVDAMKTAPLDEAMNHIKIGIEGSLNHIPISYETLREMVDAVQENCAVHQKLHLVNNDGDASLMLLAESHVTGRQFEIYKTHSFFTKKTNS